MTSVAIQSPSPAAAAGGVERFASTLTSVLNAQGLDACLIGAEYRPRPAFEKTIGGWLPWSFEAGRRLRDSDADLVVTSGLLGAGAPSIPPRVHVFHGTFPTHTWRGDGQLPAHERIRRIVCGGLAEWGASRRATVIAVSPSAAREARRLYGAHVCAVIPNGIDTDLFSPGSREEARERLGLPRSGALALFVGRPEHRKGADLIPGAVKGTGFQLVVAGPQPLLGSIHLGILDQPMLRDAYRAVDCLLMPSRYEACSFVILEALASGTPVVATNAGFMPEVLRAVPGYTSLMTTADARSINAALHALSRARASDITELTSAARSFVLRQCSLPVFGSRWVAVIRHLIDQQMGSTTQPVAPDLRGLNG